MSSFLPLPNKSTPPRKTNFSLPLPLTTYSHLPNRSIEFNLSACCQYTPPPIGAWLGEGFERTTWRDETVNEHLDGLELALEKLGGAFGGKGSSGEPAGGGRIVTWRGVMTRVLTAPYEDRDSFSLNVLYDPSDSNIYIEIAEKLSSTPKDKFGEMLMYHGYALESYSTRPFPTSSSAAYKPPIPSPYAPQLKLNEKGVKGPPGWGGDVNTNVQWCVVVKTSLGGNKLILGGEVDCLTEPYNGTLSSSIELKANMEIRNAHQEVQFEKKLLKHWAQSFLLGIPTLGVGFRTRDGIMTSFQEFQLREIPRLVRGKPHAWDPNICLAFGAQALEWIKSTVTSSPSAQSTSDLPLVWRVDFEPNKGLSARVLGMEEKEWSTWKEEGRWGFLKGRT